MTQQSEALWLADWLDVRAACGGDNWNEKVNAAAAELRRLHAENEALQKTKHYEASLWRLRRINADLLEALKSTRAFINSVAPHGSLLERVNAAIKAPEE